MGTKGKTIPKARVLDSETWQMYPWEDPDNKGMGWIDMEPKEGEAVIRAGCGRRIRAPEIIVVANYQQIPKNQLNFNRKNLFRRDNDTCQYCGIKPGVSQLSVEHVIPKSRGGKNNWENCVVACFDCNQKKKDRTPEEADMELLRQPMKPGLEILGQSSVRLKSWEMFFGKENLEAAAS